MSLTPADRIIDKSNYDINKAVKGQRLMILYNDGTNWHAFATATSNGLSCSKDSVDVSNKSQGGWASALSGIKSWSMTCSNIVYEVAGIDMKSMFELFNKDCAIDVAFSPVTFADDGAGCTGDIDYTQVGYFLGKANVSGFDLTADNNAGATGELTFEGAGELTYEDAPA